jgi:hypothetical protein
LKLKFVCGSDTSIGVFFGKLAKEHLDEVGLRKVSELSSGGLGRSLDDGGLGHEHLRVCTDGGSIKVVLGNVGRRLSLDHGTGLVLSSLQLVVSNGSRSQDLRGSVEVGLNFRSSDASPGFEESLDLHQVHFNVLSLFGSLEFLHSLLDGLHFLFFFRLRFRVFHLSKFLHEGLTFLSRSNSGIRVLEHVGKVLEFLKRGMVVLERHNVSNGKDSEHHERDEGKGLGRAGVHLRSDLSVQVLSVSTLVNTTEVVED